MRALVVGYGSIGMRHARLLREEGCEVAVVSRREVEASPRYATVGEGVCGHRPEYVVIANRTSEHLPALEELASANFRGAVLVEKPLFTVPTPVVNHGFSKLLVAYNLRFHPGVQWLRESLRDARVLSAHAYVGQYLPTWRSGRDYRDVYSASRAEGGGVLRDLSHELDLLNWIFDGWTHLTAIGGKLSSLEIDSEDTAVLAVVFRGCPAAAIQLNYLDRLGRRFVVVNADDRTIELNLTEGYLAVNAERMSLVVDRDDSYRALHQAVLGGHEEDVCTAEEAMSVMEMIEAAEQAMDHQRWVSR